MYFYCKQQGVSLIELITCICIIGIIACIATPHFLHILQETEQKNIFPLLDQHIKFAKNSAILHHSDIVICSSVDLDTCQNDQWNTAIIIFIDRNHNQQHDMNEQLLQQTKTQLKYGNLKWNGNSTHRKLLTFKGDTGLPRGAYGSFYYCSNYDPSKHLRFKMGQMANLNVASTITC